MEAGGTFGVFNELKTVQKSFGVEPLLRHAGEADVEDLSDLFAQCP